MTTYPECGRRHKPHCMPKKRPFTLALLPLAVAVLTACSSGITKEQAHDVCIDMTAAAMGGGDGMLFTRQDIQTKYKLSTPDAVAVVRQAVSDYCPEFQHQL